MKKLLFSFISMLLLSTAVFAQSNESLNILLDEINADSLHQTVLDLQNFGSRYALREGGNKQVAEYIQHRLENYGVTAEIDSFYLEGYNWLVGNYNAWFYNVKGVLNSQNPIDDSLVIMGAHLDAISLDSYYQLQTLAPGADDNASGIAVMVEIARVLHQHPTEFRRNIYFMGFDGEELGLFGGHHDAEERLQAQEHIAVMLNNDMVSYQPDDDWRVTLHWYDNALDVLEKAVATCREYTDIEPFVPANYENGNSSASDSYAYATRNFKSVFAIEYTFSTSYHTEHDVADSNNYAYHADITRYNLAMMADYARMENTVSVTERTPFRPGSIYPNPASDKAILEFSLDEVCDANLTLTNMAGQVVRIQPLHTLNAGLNLVELDCSSLPTGLYLCRFQSDKNSWTTKMLVK
ncbi:MAG: M28 family peptidase [Bacteroidales bacterium]|nr:M28 family peptidase [Bacteroidales bacterium]